MTSKAKIFIEDARKVAFNKKHRKTIDFNMSKYEVAFTKGK